MYLSKLCECIITKKQDLGKCRGISSMKERIEEARKRADKANRLNLLEKLVALPQIKPIFEQFCKMLHRSHNRDLVRKGGPPRPHLLSKRDAGGSRLCHFPEPSGFSSPGSG